MELIIGGCFQGKLDYAKQKLKERGIEVLEEEILDGKEMLLPEGNRIWILNHLHLLVRRYMEEERVSEVIPVLERLLLTYPDILILCDEVGCGIVPIEEKEQAYREAVGRTLCHLAPKARHMVRITAGMPMKIR